MRLLPYEKRGQMQIQKGRDNGNAPDATRQCRGEGPAAPGEWN